MTGCRCSRGSRNNSLSLTVLAAVIAAILFSAKRDLHAQNYNPEPQAIFGTAPSGFGSPDSRSLLGVSQAWQMAESGGDAQITAIAFSPDGKSFATLSPSDGMIRLWDAATRTVTGRLKLHIQGKPYSGATGALAYRSGGEVLGVLIDHDLYFLKLTNDDLVGPLDDDITAFALSVDGEYVAAVITAPAEAERGPGVFVDVMSMDDILARQGIHFSRKFLAGHEPTTARVAFGDSELLVAVTSAAAGDAKRFGLTFWDRGWNEVDEFLPIAAPALAASADGHLLLAGERLYDVYDELGFSKPKQVGTLEASADFDPTTIRSVVFSATGQWVAAMTTDAFAVRFFDAATGAARGGGVPLFGGGMSLASAPDGQSLVADLNASIAWLPVAN